MGGGGSRMGQTERFLAVEQELGMQMLFVAAWGTLPCGV